MKRILALAATAALSIGALTACSEEPPDPALTAAALASGLTEGSLAKTTITQVPDLDGLLGDIAGLERTVAAVAEVDPEDTKALNLDLEWTWDVDGREWTYATEARALLSDENQWVVQWDPAIVHPAAKFGSTFEITRGSLGERAEIVSDTGTALVTARAVYRIGIDKTRVTTAAEQRESALALAEALGYDDPDAYASTVGNAGEKAFVEAITIRQEEAAAWSVDELREIPGVNVVSDERQLAPTARFARPILGRVGEATEEVIEESDGRVARGDMVGLSGLSKIYDAQLSGSPAVTIHLLVSDQPQLVFEADPEPGEDLTVTLSTQLQNLAEEIIGGAESVAALAAIEPSTGRVLAAATNDPWNVSSLGQYAPGSTFKVATSLAALRSGLSPDSTVECPETLTVDGKSFSNYPGYSHTGSITLREALAYSCNTAFIAIASELEPADIASAALSLGIGQPGPWPFEYFSGTVPTDVTPTAHAASAMGQGDVLVSPLAMAGVAASVAAGHTVTPVLVAEEGPELDSATVPLTEAEAAGLAEMMAASVEIGTSQVLGHLGGAHAKTGTAQFGVSDPPETNAWMIAYLDDLAVAMFVEGGITGSDVAGPLLDEFLTQAQLLTR